MYAQTVMNTATDLMRVFAFVFARLISRVFFPFAFPPSFGKDQGRGGTTCWFVTRQLCCVFPGG
jgi:hypothetical protein